MWYKVLCFLALSSVSTVSALECTKPDQLKVTVKLPNPDEFDASEQYLFEGTLAYAIRKYCSVIEPTPGDCTEAVKQTDTVNVHLTDQTERFAMCVTVDDVPLGLMEDSIRFSRDRFNGALELNDDTLVISGVPPTLKADTVPDFPIWLIPFIVITCLVVLAAVAIIGYTVYQNKRKTKYDPDDDDDDYDESLRENGGNNGYVNHSMPDAFTAL